MTNTDALAKLNSPAALKQPTLYDELWQKLDGAYARWRRYRRHGDVPEGISLDFMHGRVVGLVEAVAILSHGVMDQDGVKREAVRRWKDRQGLDKTNGPEDA